MLGVYPRDESVLYDPPVVTTTSIVAGSATQVIGADPDRVYLILSAGAVSSAWFNLDGSASNGIMLGTPNNSRMEFGYTTAPALCQAAWYAAGQGAGGIVYVVTVTLRRPPDYLGYDLFTQRKAMPGVQLFIPPQGIRPARPRSRPLHNHVLAALRQRAPRIFGEE